MKEPKKIPLDPSRPKAIKVQDDKIVPLRQLYLFTDNVMPDNDSFYGEIQNEDFKESNKT
jgi:hypothetical protein